MIAQILGFSAIASSLLIYTQRRRGAILGFKLMQDLLLATHYLLLGAHTAMASNLICAAREIVFRSRRRGIAESRAIFSLFLLLYIASTILTWRGPFSLLPMASSLISTVAFRIKEPRFTKLAILPSSLCTLCYNMAVSHSAAVYVGCSITVTTVCVSLIVGSRKGAYKIQKDKEGENV